MKKTLEHITVVDMTGAVAGPACTKLLADYGAKVIVVEPLTGSTSRVQTPYTAPDGTEYDYLYPFLHGGKQSIPLNLKHPEGQQVMRRLLEQADVFVSNFRLKALERLGLSYEAVKAIRPDIIYAVITGFGEEGPCKDDPGYDNVSFWAQGGLMIDWAEKGTMIVPPIGVGDTLTGQGMAGAICAALFHRSQTGEGMKLSTSLLAQAVYANNAQVISSQLGVELPRSRKSPVRAFHNTYVCRDGKALALSSVSYERDYANILHCLHLEELLGDPRWQSFEDTIEHADTLTPILDEAFLRFDRDDILARLQEKDIAACRVQTSLEVCSDPQVLVNQDLVPFRQCGQEMMIPVSPVKFGELTPPPPGPGPKLTEFTADILAQCGYTPREMESLVAQGITLPFGQETEA